MRRKLYDYWLPPGVEFDTPEAEVFEKLAQCKTKAYREEIWEQMKRKYGRLRQNNETLTQFLHRIDAEGK
jgi:hypothetical protein